METQFIGDDDEIPRWNRDRLWKRNLSAVMAKFQGGIETSCGNVDDDEISNVEKRQLLKCK